MTFWLLNPWWSIVLRDFNWQVQYYGRAAARRGSSHGQVLWGEADFLLRHHGVLIVCALVLGSCALIWRILKGGEKHRELAMVLGFWMARRLPIWASLVIVLGFEVLTMAIIRDGLALNVLMLLFPLESVMEWQNAR